MHVYVCMHLYIFIYVHTADSSTSDSWNLSSKEKLDGLSREIEDNLDWCIDLLQSMNSKKTAGQMAQEQV